MARKYVSQCTVLVDGVRQQNLKNFKWNDRRYREQIKLMDGVGTIDTIPDQTFTFDYVVPKSGARLDWSDVSDATVIVALKGGGRVVFGGVDSMSDGEMSLDGTAESAMTVTFSYETTVIE
jgi:hypothetical protein